MKKTPRLTVIPRRHEAWLEVELDECWTAAYRLAVRGETADVAELRIFPTQSGATNRTAGRWDTKHTQVPAGGVKTRVLRSVKLGHAVHSLDRIVRYLSGKHGRAAFSAHEFGASGLTPHTRGVDARRGSVGGRGRPALSDAEYAAVAERYVAAMRGGSEAPLVEVAHTLDLSVSTVRGRIETARQRVLLTRAGGHGCRGGRLTKRGQAALRRRQKKR